MTPRIPENFSTWLVGWNLVTVMGDTSPPRDPNDDDEDEEEDEDEDEDDNNNNNDKQKDDSEPAIIRDPDEDE
jgi:hypothetical protein